MTTTFLAAARRALFLLSAVALLSACDSGDGGGGTPGSPNANAGSDQTADVGTPVTLDASASTDPDGDALSFSWAFQTTPAGSAVTLAAATATATFTPDVAGSYVARVTVSDGTGTDTDDVTITVAQPTIIELTDDYTADATLPAGVYRVAAGRTITVRGGALTLSPGVRIDFGAGAGLSISSDGGLIANGTAAQPILLQGGQATPGYWRGIAIYSNDPRNVLNYTTVAHGGSARYAGMDLAANVSLDNSARVSVTNSTVRDGSEQGISLDLSAEFGSFAANAFSGNQEYPLRAGLGAAGALDAATTFSGNGESFVTLEGGTLSDDVSLAAIALPYRFSGVHGITAALLSLQPGVRAVFAANAGLQINSDGALRSVGTAAAPISITGEQPDAGFWRGIAIYSNDTRNVLDHTTVAHGGGARYAGMDLAANVSVDNADRLSITNSTIRDGSEQGLSLDAAATLAAFSANTFTGNGEYPVRLHLATADALDAATAFSGNGESYVAVAASGLNDDVTLAALGVPYLFFGAHSVNAELVVQPGADLAFRADASMSASSSGSINAVGTAANRITFRGEEDVQGYWRGIAIYSNNSNNVFDHVTLANGGGARFSGLNQAANLAVDNADRVTVTNSTIRSSGAWGLQADPAAAFTQTGNTFSNNVSGDVNED